MCLRVFLRRRPGELLVGRNTPMHINLPTFFTYLLPGFLSEVNSIYWDAETDRNDQ